MNEPTRKVEMKPVERLAHVNIETGELVYECPSHWGVELATSMLHSGERLARVQITEGWRPFSELVPKPWKNYIVHHRDAGVFEAIYREAADPSDGEFLWFTTDGEDLTSCPPTEYMEMPAPPKITEIAEAAPVEGE